MTTSRPKRSGSRAATRNNSCAPSEKPIASTGSSGSTASTDVRGARTRSGRAARRRCRDRGCRPGRRCGPRRRAGRSSPASASRARTTNRDRARERRARRAREACGIVPTALPPRVPGALPAGLAVVTRSRCAVYRRIRRQMAHHVHETSAPPAGLEPAASSLEVTCSVQLSYGGVRRRLAVCERAPSDEFWSTPRSEPSTTRGLSMGGPR